MTARTLILIIVLSLHIFCLHADEYRENLCPEVTGCECYEGLKRFHSDKEDVKCNEAIDPSLHLLRQRNVGRILITRCTFNNISQLNELGATNAERFSFIQTKFPNEENPLFNWDWLPSTATNLSLTQNGFSGFRSGNVSNGCQTERFESGAFNFYANEENFPGIPTCLPDQTDKISLLELPENIIQNEVTWPKKLKILRLTHGGFGNISSNLFVHTPDSLATIWISHQQLFGGNWPKGLPSHSLRKLLIMHSELAEIPESEIQKFNKANVLKHLWLSYNKLRDIPLGLPVSLEHLRINNNEIKYITEENWSTMKNLVVLDLSNNQLTTVPMGMPPTLQQVILRRNEIYGSNPDAFRSLKDLKTLDLSYNKLTALPEGIQPGIEVYLVSKNQISLVTGPKVYDFCTKCSSVQLFGNPWHCNLEMLKMLNWFVLNNVTIHDPGQKRNNQEHLTYCNKIGLRGVDANWLKLAIEFMDYFRLPPNDKCIYEIETLTCQDADLLELPKHLPPGLEEIVVSDNPNLTSIPDYKLWNQTVLTKLELDNNSLSHIPVGMPTSVKLLSLKYNNLGNWSKQDLVAFQNLTLLRQIYLNDNNIKVLYEWQFEGLNDLNWISLVGNPLHCDCSIQSFAYFFERIIPTTTNTIARQYPTCASPSDQKGVDIRQLYGYFSYGLQCTPLGCIGGLHHILNCSKANRDDETSMYIYEEFVPGEEVVVPNNGYWTGLDLSGLELRTDQINYRNLSRLEVIDLSHNVIDEIPLQGLPASIECINLLNNSVSVLPPHKIIKQHLPRLQELDLRNNQIKIIESQVSNLEVISKVLLQGNPLVCNCTSRPFVEWVHANAKNAELNERHQLQLLTCHVQKQPQLQLISEVIEAEYCPPPPSVGGILGGIAAIIVVLLLAVVLANVYYQRERSKKINAEILLGFQGLLDKENDAQKDPETGMGIGRDYKFDAFVSYDPDGVDAEFVISLLEELEDKRGYKLCLHERDFIPGASVTDNIVECIGASKHVILVLSRTFISSPWCQYEVQAALAELHQRRRSQLLISVLLEDISVDEDIMRSVRTLLSLAPGLTVPQYMPDGGKDWMEVWNRLMNLMPHPIVSEEV